MQRIPNPPAHSTYDRHLSHVHHAGMSHEEDQLIPNLYRYLQPDAPFSRSSTPQIDGDDTPSDQLFPPQDTLNNNDKWDPEHFPLPDPQGHNVQDQTEFFGPGDKLYQQYHPQLNSMWSQLTQISMCP